MITSNPKFRLLAFIPALLLLQSCATPVSEPEPKIWQQLVAASSRQSVASDALKIHIEVRVQQPGHTLLVATYIDNTAALLYRVSLDRIKFRPFPEGRLVNCRIGAGSVDSALSCAAPGEDAAELAGPQDDLWKKLEEHAIAHLARQKKADRATLRAELDRKSLPRLNLMRQRHPFEWGGSYETIENAQELLDVALAQGMTMASTWPEPPQITRPNGTWENDNETVVFRSTGSCMSQATSPRRVVSAVVDGKTLKSTYRWTQPIDWKEVRELEMMDDGIFLRGSVYETPYVNEALVFLDGWNPGNLTANVPIADQVGYGTGRWNLRLYVPKLYGLRERMFYAMTYLKVMCGQRADQGSR